MACLTVMDGPLKGQKIELDRPIIRIGRKAENDWVLQDNSVSGIHCEVVTNNASFIIRDLGSTNGTHVNSEAVKEKALYRNDIILIGEIPIMIEGEDIAPSSLAEPSSMPRTTIVIQQKRTLETPKEFAKKSSSTKIWIALIVVLVIISAVLLGKMLSS